MAIRASSARGERDDLERRARRLQAGEGDPGEAEQLAVAGVERHDAAQAAGERRRSPRARRSGRSSCGPRGPARGAELASSLPPASRRPPGRPISATSRARSRPESPTGAPGGTPSAVSSACRSGGAGPSRPTVSAATSATDGDAVRAAPCASTLPSRDSSVARGGSVDLARELRAPGHAGEGQRAAPVHARGGARAGQRQVERRRTVPKMRVRTTIGTRTIAVAGALGAAGDKAPAPWRWPARRGAARRSGPAHPALRGGRQLAVHRGVSPRAPRRDVALGDRPRVRAGAGRRPRARRRTRPPPGPQRRRAGGAGTGMGRARSRQRRLPTGSRRVRWAAVAVTLLDALILLFTVLMAATGWRRGFLVGALGLAGFVGGALLGTRLAGAWSTPARARPTRRCSA